MPAALESNARDVRKVTSDFGGLFCLLITLHYNDNGCYSRVLIKLLDGLSNPGSAYYREPHFTDGEPEAWREN